MRMTCGFWLVVYKVYSSLPLSYSPMATRGSIALGISRLLTISMLLTCAALANASSVAAASPISQSKQTLSGASSHTTGAASALAADRLAAAGNSS